MADALSSFCCYKDKDIEDFLKFKALDFIARKWCSVYLITDEEAFNQGKIKIEAYFTLSHKSLIPQSASKSQIKKGSGFKDAGSIHFVLIGQLGKFMKKNPSGSLCADITAEEILDYAFEVIRASSALIPCRCALVECSKIEKVQQVYLNYGFTFFQPDGDLYQYIKQI